MQAGRCWCGIRPRCYAATHIASLKRRMYGCKGAKIGARMIDLTKPIVLPTHSAQWEGREVRNV